MVRFLLNIIVFVSGAVLMGLEIVGSRVLAPYFGSSIFVWGSLISVVMAALSIGYYARALVWPAADSAVDSRDFNFLPAVSLSDIE